MKKLLLATVAATALLSVPVQAAGILDAIKGHVEDLTTRFGSDEVIENYDTKVSVGEFNPDYKGTDRLHRVWGDFSIVEVDGERFVQLEASFKSTIAPDLFIYVSPDRDIEDKAAFDSTTQINLGKLAKSKGASYYAIPEGVDVQSVTIWCEDFSVYMGSGNVTIEGDKS